MLCGKADNIFSDANGAYPLCVTDRRLTHSQDFIQTRLKIFLPLGPQANSLNRHSILYGAHPGHQLLDILARFLVGGDRPCRIAEAAAERKSLVEVFSPIRHKPYPPAGYTGVRLYAELAEVIRTRQIYSTLNPR